MSTAETQARWRERKRAGLVPERAVTSNPPLTAAEKSKRYRDRKRAAGAPVKRRAKPKGKIDQPFMGVDGEGCGTDALGRQCYMLMRASDGVDNYELFTGKPLSTRECLNWILDLPEDRCLVSYSLGYDLTMMLLDLPSHRRRSIVFQDFAAIYEAQQDHGADKYGHSRTVYTHGDTTPQRRSGYTYWNEFAIEYLPANYLLVNRLEENGRGGRRPVYGGARRIVDVMGHFKTDFHRALLEHGIGTAEEQETIRRMKRRRSKFAEITQEIRDYCALECALLARLMEHTRGVCEAAEIRPHSWAGSGKLAAALHKQWETPTADMLMDWLPRHDAVMRFAQGAYYGGRFECPMIGRIPGPVYAHDINSAFAHGMLNLPCLLHGEFVYRDADELRHDMKRNPDMLAIVDAHYQHRGQYRVCGVPHRFSGHGMHGRFGGSTCWPIEGKGTYWTPELRSAEALGCRWRFAGGGMAYRSHCDCQSFPGVPALYGLRNRPGGAIIKGALTALYGKLAESIGAAKFHNWLWAGLITARTRAAINRAVAEAPGNVAMIATDAVYTIGAPLGVPQGEGLGQWKVKTYADGLFVVQPGLYWGNGALKTRGLSPGYFGTRTRQLPFERAWQRFAEKHRADSTTGAAAVNVTLNLFVGLKLAEAREQPDLAGQWLREPRAVSFEWGVKRSRADWRDGPYIHTIPRLGGEGWISTAYDTDPATIDAAAIGDLGAELADQPDFVILNADSGF